LITAIIIGIIIGIFVGFFSGFLGIGGGTVLVPVLLFLGFGFKEAIGISVTQMMLSSIYGSYLNYKKGLLKIKNGLSLALGGALGAALSGFIVKHRKTRLKRSSRGHILNARFYRNNQVFYHSKRTSARTSYR